MQRESQTVSRKDNFPEHHVAGVNAEMDPHQGNLIVNKCLGKGVLEL